LKLSLDFPLRRTPIRDLLYRNRQNRGCRRIAKTRPCLRPIRIQIFRRASQNLSAHACGIRLWTSQANFVFQHLRDLLSWCLCDCSRTSIDFSNARSHQMGHWQRLAERKFTMTALEGKKCAHPNCSCQVQSRGKYCSAQCEAAGDTPDIDCKCEHPGCAGRID